jgi:hypothetical protein
MAVYRLNPTFHPPHRQVMKSIPIIMDQALKKPRSEHVSDWLRSNALLCGGARPKKAGRPIFLTGRPSAIKRL